MLEVAGLEFEPVRAEMVTSGRDAETVDHLLSRIAGELVGSADTLRDLRFVVDPKRDVPVVAMQGLDLVEQTLRELGSLVDALSPLGNRPLSHDAAAVLAACKLTTLAMRLRGMPSEVAVAAGEVELF